MQDAEGEDIPELCFGWDTGEIFQTQFGLFSVNEWYLVHHHDSLFRNEYETVEPVQIFVDDG